MKAVVAAFNQEKALVGAFSVITNLRMDLFEALQETLSCEGGLNLNYSGEDVQPADLPHPGRRPLLLAPAGRLAVHLGHGAGREGGLREGHQAHAQVQHSGEAQTFYSLC